VVHLIEGIKHLLVQSLRQHELHLLIIQKFRLAPDASLNCVALFAEILPIPLRLWYK
jgi:hypothetical protein